MRLGAARGMDRFYAEYRFRGAFGRKWLWIGAALASPALLVAALGEVSGRDLAFARWCVSWPMMVGIPLVILTLVGAAVRIGGFVSADDKMIRWGSFGILKETGALSFDNLRRIDIGNDGEDDWFRLVDDAGRRHDISGFLGSDRDEDRLVSFVRQHHPELPISGHRQ